jgi:peptidoglycan/xylan/chitin deacetylase (PgdA/CDA1 family)
MSRPIASVSLDLDDLWTYQRTHGDPEWERRTSYLPVLMPLVLDLLDEAGCRVTFFIVGADAATAANARWMRMITERGHEAGNHSYRHECWLHRYEPDQLERELASAEAAIAAATGQRTVGFRGPGFSWSPELLEILAAHDYRYDASTLPTYLGPLARAYFLATSRLTAEQRERRDRLFGGWADGLRPTGAYQWRLSAGRKLLEIPVTTIPGIKTPFHMSYLIWLSRFSRAAMRGYLRAALMMCRQAAVGPSFLLHPLDVLGPEDAPQLAFFPGMDVPGKVKRALVREVLGTLSERYTLVPMGAHADHLLGQERLPLAALPRASAPCPVGPQTRHDMSHDSSGGHTAGSHPLPES